MGLTDLAQQFRGVETPSQSSNPSSFLRLLQGVKNENSAWASSFTRKSDMQAEFGLPERKQEVVGQTAGIDFGHPGQAPARVGISLGRMRISTQYSFGQGQTDIDMIGLNSAISLGQKNLDIYAFGASGDTQLLRKIDIDGIASSIATAQIPTKHFGIGTRLQWVSNNPSDIQPFVGMSAMWHRSSNYTESGAGSANLSVDAHQSRSQNFELGMKLKSDSNQLSKSRWQWLVELSGRYSRMKSDDISQRFVDTTDYFTAQGFQRSTTGVRVFASTWATFNTNSVVHLGLTASKENNQTSSGLQITYRLAW